MDKPIAAMAIYNTASINIWAVDDDKVLSSLNNGPRRWAMLRTDNDGRAYFVKYRTKYLLDDFIRV